MKHLLALLLLFSFSAFAYDNPYSNQRNWEAEKRYNGEFSDGRQAHYFDRKYDSYEREQRRNADAEREMRDFRDSVERDRY